MRRRIIAGLAAGTLVVEGAPKSPLDPRAQGCNLLIREGATLVQSAADVVEALSAFGQGIGTGSQLRMRFKAAESAGWYDAAPIAAGDAERSAVEALLSPTPVAIDEVVRLSGLAAAVVATVLLDLELMG